MLKIGELSKLCGLPVKTLRYYDSIGLLTPDEVDRFTGYRYYSASKLAECNRIVALKELGFSLEEIAMQIGANGSDVESLIERKISEIEKLIEESRDRISRLRTLKNNVSEGDRRLFNVVIKGADSLRVASVRRIFSDREEAYRTIDEMRRLLPDRMLGTRNLLVCYETEYKENDLDIEVGVEITAGMPKEYKYEEKIIDLTSTASVVCPRECIKSAEMALYQQMRERDGGVSETVFEICYDDGTVELRAQLLESAALYEKYSFDDVRRLTFENDVAVVGKWEIVDVVPELRNYSPNNKKCGYLETFWLKELYFLENGEGYWTFYGWSSGKLFYMRGEEISAWKYEIRRMGDEELLLLYMNSGDGMSQIGIYRKRDNIQRSARDIRIFDNVDLPYILDEKAVGAWYAIGCCTEIDGFLPDGNGAYTELFWRKFEINVGGDAVMYLGNNERRHQVEWTEGVVIDKALVTASEYLIKEIGGKEYLFVEWKSGDYIYGGRKPCYYVFERDVNF